MPFYRYKYLSPLGKVENSTEFFDSDDSFLKEIQIRKLQLIRFKKGYFLEKYRPYLSWKATAQTLGDLSSLLNSNLSLFEAAKILSELSGSGPFKRAYRQFCFLITQGVSLGQALGGAFGRILPPAIMWILIGAANMGKFSESLTSIHDYAQWRALIHQERVNAYRYPLTLAVVVIFLIVVSMEFIAPQVHEFMTQNNMPTPPLLDFFYQKGVQIHSTWVLMGLFCFMAASRLPFVNKSLSRALRGIRPLKHFLNLMLFAQFFRIMATSLKTGMNEEEILNRLKAQYQENGLHPVLGQMVTKIHGDVTKGHSFSGALARISSVPPYISEIVALGEAKGNLESTCFDLSELLKNNFQRRCQLLIAWTQVFFMIIITLMIFLLAEMTVLPLYENLFKLSY